MFGFWHILTDIFFPHVCVQCKKKIPEGLFCVVCRREVEDFRILQPTAYGCPDIDGICLLYRYDLGIKKALHDVKFHGQKGLLEAMAQEMRIINTPKQVFKLWHTSKPIVVVPIPTDKERVVERGYDVPVGIFHKWSLAQGLEWREALVRVRQTRPQYGLDRHDRRKNVQGCFLEVMDIKGKNVLLIDDIFTSGATVQEAAHVLHKHGAAHIFVLAFAGGSDGGK